MADHVVPLLPIQSPEIILKPVEQTMPGTNLTPMTTPMTTPIGTPVVGPVTIEKEHHDDSIVHYEDDSEKRNSSYQMAWRRVMAHGPYNASSSYEKASVLLLSWDKDFDDLDVKGEVDCLGALFSDVFHFDVTKVCLKSDTDVTAQAQINLQVATFVANEDRPKRLLIVYYAGHGTPGNIEGHLELVSGKRTPPVVQDKLKDKLNKVIWNRAEDLLQDTRADVLEIFDCCYAGNLGARAPATRAFEYLAATAAGSTTKSPGPESFTSALIWALKELVKEKGCFTTQQLMHKIKRNAPNFPRGQTPVLSRRGDQNSASLITLEPISKDKDNANLVRSRSRSSHETGVPEVLTLKFVFESRPEFSEVERLGQALNEMMDGHDFRVNRIMWGGLHSWTKSIMAEAAHRFSTLGSHHRHKHQHSSGSPDFLMPVLHNRDNRRRLISTQNALFIPKTSVWKAAQENHNCNDSHHSILYHGRMLLLCIWVLCVSIISFWPEKGRAVYGPRRLISIAGLCAAMLLAFVNIRTNLDIFLT